LIKSKADNAEQSANPDELTTNERIKEVMKRLSKVDVAAP